MVHRSRLKTPLSTEMLHSSDENTPNHVFKPMNEEVHRSPLVETAMRSRQLCRPFRGYPLPLVYEEICEQARQNLRVQLDEWFNRSSISDPTLAEIRSMRDEAFRQTLNDTRLTALALEAQKHPAGSDLRRHALDNFIAALWLVHFSRKAKRSPVEEEATSETLKYICENIDQFQRERNGLPVQVMAWIEYQHKIFLGKVQKGHETQPYRFLQPDKAWKRIIGIKYELTCLITKSKRENLLTWIKLEVKRLVPSQCPDMIVALLLAAMLALAQLKALHPRDADALFFAMAEQLLAPPRFQSVSTGQDGEDEASFLENLPQPNQPKFMSDELQKYLRTDPYGILQKTVQGYPNATFQAIALQRLATQSWQAIAESFGAQKSNLSTFSTFYTRQIEKLAPQIREHLQDQFD